MALNPNRNSRVQQVTSLGLFGKQAQKRREAQKNAAQTVSDHIGSQNQHRVDTIATQLERAGSNQATQAAHMIRAAAAKQAQRQAQAEQATQPSRSMGRPG